MKLNFWNIFRQKAAISKGLLPPSGRSTVEITPGDSLGANLETLHRHFDIVNPYAPIEVQQYLTLLCVMNPDLSQVVSNNQAIGNTGHEIIIQDKKNRNITAAMNRINEKAYAFYTRSAGVDGLFNHYFNQLSISGAISSEDVLQPNLKGVDYVVIVPTFTIRFRRIDGQYKPFQKVDGYVESIPLNDLTYQYYALQSVDNSPYAIPPFISTLEPVTLQRMAMKNIRYALEKIGLLGLNTIKVKRLERKMDETDEEYIKRNQKYIDDVRSAVVNNYSKGFMVLPEDLDHKNDAISTDMRGAKDLLQVIEEQLISGAKTDGALIGRGYTRTETFATVVYNLLLAQAGNQRRLVKRRHENTIRLDLMLNGIDVEKVSVMFGADKRLNPSQEAQAANLDVTAALQKAKSGLADPDEVARELGYPEWFDKELLKQAAAEGDIIKQFRFNRRKQEYEYIMPSHSVHNIAVHKNADDQKQKDLAAKAGRDMQRLIDDYLRDTIPFYDSVKEKISNWALDWTKQNIDTLTKDPASLTQAVREYITENNLYKNLSDDKQFQEKVKTFIVDAGKHFKDDKLVWGLGKDPGLKFNFSEGDLKAMEFYSKLDYYFFSSFISNEDFGSQINQYINQFISRGEGEFNNWTDSAEKEFIRQFGRCLMGDVEFQMKRIVSSSIGRLRSYGHFGQLQEAGFVYARINAILDDRCTSGVCPEMNGKLIPIKAAWNWIEKFTQCETIDQALEMIKSSSITHKDMTKQDIEEMIKNGQGLCPFHVLCRCWATGYFEES